MLKFTHIRMTLPPLHLKPQIQTGNQKQLKEIVTTLNLYHQKKEEISRPEKYYEIYPYALLHAIIFIRTAKLYEKWVTSKINAKVIYKSSARCFSVTWEILNTVFHQLNKFGCIRLLPPELDLNISNRSPLSTFYLESRQRRYTRDLQEISILQTSKLGFLLQLSNRPKAKSLNLNMTTVHIFMHSFPNQ